MVWFQVEQRLKKISSLQLQLKKQVFLGTMTRRNPIPMTWKAQLWVVLNSFWADKLRFDCYCLENLEMFALKPSSGYSKGINFSLFWVGVKEKTTLSQIKQHKNEVQDARLFADENAKNNINEFWRKWYRWPKVSDNFIPSLLKQSIN